MHRHWLGSAALFATLTALTAFAAPRRAYADEPLAVIAPDTTSAVRVTVPERTALADAIAQVLTSGGIRDVLSGTETRSRVDALDPAQLSCAAPQCASQVASLLHARAVLLVRAQLTGHELTLELTLVSASGDVVTAQRGQTVIGEWDDAVALGRVVAGRLLAAMRAATPNGNTGAGVGTSTPSAPGMTMVDRPRANVPLLVTGGVLLAGGLVAIIAPIPALTSPSQCVGTAAECNPTGPGPVEPALHDSPSPLNFAWIAVGGVGVITGAVLMIIGATGRERVQVAVPAGPSPAARARAQRPQLGFAGSPGGAMFTLGGAF